MTANQQEHVLSGYKVLDFTQHIAGPTATRLLVEMGAEVIKVELAPGAIARMGLGYETVKSLNPKIVMCSISAFGQQGPLASKPGYDFIGAAYAGILDMNGDPNGSPCFPGMAIGDTSTGVHAVAAIACALLYRERTGKGQYLDISLVDSYFHYHETSVQAYSLSGGAYPPRRVGSHYPLYAPVGMFKGKSHYLVIMAPTDHQWAAVCRAMGKPL